MMSLALLAEALHAPREGVDVQFTGVSTDTRTLTRGDLFVALVGPNFDGHSFLAEAITAGASGALLSQRLPTTLPYVLVPDTRLALGQFATFWRNQFQIPVVAVTGSNGKTTVKEMIGAILSEGGAGCVTRGNLNNDIGVPLTLLRLRRADRFAVIEMGMNHAGEIDYLTRLTRPGVAVITNAAEAHLAGLGTIEAVAKAKGEIFAGLGADGVAVINADDPFVMLWQNLARPRRTLLFGMASPADVSVDYQPDGRGSSLLIHTPQGETDARLNLLGRHNVLNALAATAAAQAAGATLKQIRVGLSSVQPVPGRLQPRAGISEAQVIDDTYNANPGSVLAALQVLKDLPGERVLVLGDMAELGAAAAATHRRVGELAAQSGIHRLYVMGELTRHTAEAYGKKARHFATHEALIDVLLDQLHPAMTVLVKGSRVMQMERIVKGIVRSPNDVVTKGA